MPACINILVASPRLISRCLFLSGNGGHRRKAPLPGLLPRDGLRRLHQGPPDATTRPFGVAVTNTQPGYSLRRKKPASASLSTR